MADFCIENSQRSGNDRWYDAIERCNDPSINSNDTGRPAGLRLCSMGEWQLACRLERTGRAPNISGMNSSGWEWTGDVSRASSEYAHTTRRCDNGEVSHENWGNHYEFRCCKSL
tara:strand:- start:6593 stop:6934 length:342 start_codon:yes stop_codon:yes gene_type:complete